MASVIKFLTPDGVQPAPYTADSLAEATKYEPHDGVYTTIRTYNTFSTLWLNAHLDRMQDSARREGIPLIIDRFALRAAIREVVEELNAGDARVRITVARDNPKHFIISAEPFTTPIAQLVKEGVRCVTAPGSARRNPSAKTTDWMHDRERYVMPEGVYERLLLNANGDILEGFCTNFYAILDGTLYTADEGVLAGISRQIVYAVAPGVVSLSHTPVNVDQLQDLDEAFITSSSRGIIPVIKIDDTLIGDGKPGTLTMRLRRAYDLWATAQLEEL